MKNFAITGVAGYIAPRHLQAIKDTGNNLIAASDPHDSVGILDRFFPDTSYFREFERFDRHLDKLHRYDKPNKMDYLSICSPNYLHDAHIRLALRLDADAICEKPLVIKPENLDTLADMERETGRKVYNILQLRVHPALIALHDSIHSKKSNTKHVVNMDYITSRGIWYKYSWKGDIEKSGGVATNIGIHFFDMLMWMFGKPQVVKVYERNENKVSGFIELENAYVNWRLSIDADDLPGEVAGRDNKTYRSITVDGNEIEFTNGFTDLHTEVYRRILAGEGFSIDDARPSIELVYNINHAQIQKPE